MYKIFFLILFCLSLTQPQAASFDCAKAGTPFEKTICSNPNLSSLDERVAQLYGAAKASATNPEQLKAEQINWIKEARTCGTDALCIEVAYRNRAIALTPRPVIATPSAQKPASNNFLIGLCEVSSNPKSDPPVTSCSVNDLRNRPVWSTFVMIYGATDQTLMLMSGQKPDPTSSRKEINKNFPVTYISSGENEIVATNESYGGCIISKKFTKKGNDIFREDLPAKGTCDKNQLRATEESIKQGKVKISYLKVSN